eukprot:1228847-Amphidinium_carterae.1
MFAAKYLAGAVCQQGYTAVYIQSALESTKVWTWKTLLRDVESQPKDTMTCTHLGETLFSGPGVPTSAPPGWKSI